MKTYTLLNGKLIRYPNGSLCQIADVNKLKRQHREEVNGYQNTMAKLRDDLTEMEETLTNTTRVIDGLQVELKNAKRK